MASIISHTRPGQTAMGQKKPTWRRLVEPRVLLLIIAFLALWEVASLLIGGYSIPQISDVAAKLRETVTTADGLQNLLTTLARVAVGLVAAFILGTLLGLGAGVSERAAGYLLPVIRFIQGIPSLSWVILAVIWFANVELRVFFVMLLVTMPGFALQAYDSYRSIPAELRDMARSFRPGRWALFREITLPGITPGIFTGWKVNLGLGIRMVLVAELVGATIGVGSQLLSAQQLFDTAAVVSWTLLLAVCLLLVQALLDGLEAYALRYRAAPQTANGPQNTVSGSAPLVAAKG